MNASKPVSQTAQHGLAPLPAEFAPEFDRNQLGLGLPTPNQEELALQFPPPTRD